MRPYYEDDGITLYHGDAIEVMRSLPHRSIDMVLTDPPYGHNNNNGDLAHRRESVLGIRATTDADARPIANDGPEATDLFRVACAEFSRLLDDGCCCCCCCCGGGPDPQFARWSLILDEAIGFKHAVVWRKPGIGMGWHYRRDYELILIAQKPGAAARWYGGRNQSNVIETPGWQRGGNIDHPTPKPESLMGTMIELHSQPGHVVLDPFAGSGTTLVAARRLGRRAIGVEIDQTYCDVIVRRLAQRSIFEESTG